jgi:DNA-binding transcriptional LysR family regulator
MTSPVDIRLLLTFATVAREGNLTRASAQLHLTQPAVSLQLRRLARDTGVTLFRRTAAGVTPTREGALLAAKAEQVLAAAGDFRQTARRLTTQASGKLRIGTVIDPEFTRLGALLKALVASGSGIETELRQGMSGEVPVGLQRDALDVGFFLGEVADCEVRPEDAPSSFHVETLARVRYRVVAPPAFEGLVRCCGWAELAALPWVGTPPASVHHRLLKRHFADLGVKQHVIALVDQEASMLAMVRAGVGLCLCREQVALQEKQANGLAIPDCAPLDTTLSLICLARRRSEWTVSTAFELVRNIWGSGQLA